MQIEKRYQLEEAKIKQQTMEAQKQADLAATIINGSLTLVGMGYRTTASQHTRRHSTGVATSAQSGSDTKY